MGAIIRHIGNTLAIEDDEIKKPTAETGPNPGMTYLKRSFCILEIAATPEGALKFPLNSKREEDREDMKDAYEAGATAYEREAKEEALKVDSKTASTRFENDKRAVDEFILEQGGFEVIDKRVKTALSVF